MIPTVRFRGWIPHARRLANRQDHSFSSVPDVKGVHALNSSSCPSCRTIALPPWRRARWRPCSPLRFDPAGGRAFGHGRHLRAARRRHLRDGTSLTARHTRLTSTRRRRMVRFSRKCRSALPSVRRHGLRSAHSVDALRATTERTSSQHRSQVHDHRRGWSTHVCAANHGPRRRVSSSGRCPSRGGVLQRHYCPLDLLNAR